MSNYIKPTTPDLQGKTVKVEMARTERRFIKTIDGLSGHLATVKVTGKVLGTWVGDDLNRVVVQMTDVDGITHNVVVRRSQICATEKI